MLTDGLHNGWGLLGILQFRQQLLEPLRTRQARDLCKVPDGRRIQSDRLFRINQTRDRSGQVGYWIVWPRERAMAGCPAGREDNASRYLLGRLDLEYSLARRLVLPKPELVKSEFGIDFFPSILDQPR